jgi:Flp pilus assembly protein TadG
MSKTEAQRGATLVEAAFTLLILFIFLMGTIDLGRAYNVYQTMTDAAREGARFAVSPCSSVDTTGCSYGKGVPPATGDVQNKVQKYLDAALVKNATIIVTPITESVGAGTVRFTQVKISNPYTFFFLPFSITINAQAVMRNEYNN